MRASHWIAAAATAGLALASAAPASGATEFGNNCQASTAAPGYTFVQLQNAPGSPLPVAAPVGGVITKWKTTLPTIPGTLPQRLKVFRPMGGANQFQAIAESASANAGSGTSTFETRIPVQAGDHLGLFGGPGEGEATFLCVTENPGDAMGVFKGDVPSGSTQTFESTPKAQVPVAAIIEPDADGDGFGDETQDKCPQSAALQTECPVVVVDSFPLLKKGSVVVLVTTSATAPVTVSGSVKLPKGGRAGSSAQAKLKKVTHTVAAGKLVRFTLKFPGSLRSALAGLPHGKSLKLKLKASAKDVAGRIASDKSTVKLKGTA